MGPQHQTLLFLVLELYINGIKQCLLENLSLALLAQHHVCEILSAVLGTCIGRDAAENFMVEQRAV